MRCAALVLVSWAAAAGARAESPAPATSGAAISEVVVTAQRREQNIQDVALSIVAKTGAQLQLAGVNNLVALQRLAPNLGLTSTAQYAGTAIRMRGFGASSNSGIDPDVAPYLDGVYIPRPGAVMTSFLDVASVEVLRGPQGTLFGRNASVGAISINTTAPSLAGPSGEIAAQVGTWGERRLEVIGNQPVSSTFALRAAAFVEHSDGWIKNTLDGRTYGAQDTGAGRLSARWAPTPSLTWTGRADYAQTTGDGVNATPVDTTTATPAQLAAFVGKLGGLANAPALLPGPSFTAHQRFDTGLNDRQYGLSSDLSWSPAGRFTVRLIDAYRRWANDQTDGDYVLTPLNLLSRNDAYLSQSQSHELQFLSPRDAWLDGRLNLVAGLYYFSETYKIAEAFSLGTQYCGFIAASKPALVGPCHAGPARNAAVGGFSQTATSIAGYAQADYRLPGALTLTLGVRDTADRKTGAFAERLNNAAASVVRAAESDPHLAIFENQPTWRANLAWRPNAQVMAFVSYSTGYKSGGLNSSGGSSALTPARRVFRPETSGDFELGLKSVWLDQRVLVNADLFETDIQQFQDRSFDGTGFIIRNAGDVRARGVEVEAQAALAFGFKLEAAGDYLDSIYTRNANAPGLPGCTGAANSCPTTQDLSGHANYYAPQWQANAALEYDSRPLIAGLTMRARVDVTYVDRMFTTNDGNPQSVVAPRTLLGARVNLMTADKTWTLSLYGENLTDARYYTSKFTQALDSLLGVRTPANGHTLMRGFLGAPLTAGVSLTKTF